jgi:hypothetical protein
LAALLAIYTHFVAVGRRKEVTAAAGNGFLATKNEILAKSKENTPNTKQRQSDDENIFRY